MAVGVCQVFNLDSDDIYDICSCSYVTVDRHELVTFALFSRNPIMLLYITPHITRPMRIYWD